MTTWLGYRFPGVQRLLRPAPLLLIKDGRIQQRNLRQEMITEEELMAQPREQGIESVEEVWQGGHSPRKSETHKLVSI